jgi:hypothetical protein
MLRGKMAPEKKRKLNGDESGIEYIELQQELPTQPYALVCEKDRVEQEPLATGGTNPKSQGGRKLLKVRHSLLWLSVHYTGW